MELKFKPNQRVKVKFETEFATGRVDTIYVECRGGRYYLLVGVKFDDGDVAVSYKDVSEVE